MAYQQSKRIILAESASFHRCPITQSISKQIDEICRNIEFYFALSRLSLRGIRQLSLIGNSRSAVQFSEPREDCFRRRINICHALESGYNIFYGYGAAARVQSRGERQTGAGVFPYHGGDPERYDVFKFDANHGAITIEDRISLRESKMQ